MPVLMLALRTLGAFGVIGALLNGAVILESHNKKNKQAAEIGSSVVPAGKRV